MASRNFARWSLCAAVMVFGVIGPGIRLAQAGADEVAAVLERFAKAWPEDRTPYRTSDDTTTWKDYALSMRALVAMGDKAVPQLIEACDDPNYQVRALTARVLGYLKAEAAVPKLIELLEDSQPQAALQAADALGQIQDPAGLAALKTAQTTEKRGDVLLHIAKSLERKIPLENDVVQQILLITPQSVDSAELGQVAPDFTLKDSTGKPWKLSDLKGKKSVVLAFIYGDG